MKVKIVLTLLGIFSMSAYADDAAKKIIKDAIDQYRGETSYSVAEMIVHRPDWERRMEMKAWTEGTNKSLVRIIAPAKDAGNGNLLLGDDMWSFNPKINRVIKIPSSMAHQSWMGSDFSNNDMARADDLVEKYDHKILEKSTHEGRTLYAIESTPHDDAPVVWGKEIVKVRDDFIVVEHAFYDQSGGLVKTLTATAIKKIDGRTIAVVQRMQRSDKPDEWTEFRMKEVKFNIKIPASYFSLAYLRNPRE